MRGRGRGKPKSSQEMTKIKKTGAAGRPPGAKNKSTPTPSPSTSRGASEKPERGKRKSAVNNKLIKEAHQEALASQSKQPPAKKRKLDVRPPGRPPATSTPSHNKTASGKAKSKSWRVKVDFQEIGRTGIEGIVEEIKDIPNISSNQGAEENINNQNEVEKWWKYQHKQVDVVNVEDPDSGKILPEQMNSEKDEDLESVDKSITYHVSLADSVVKNDEQKPEKSINNKEYDENEEEDLADRVKKSRRSVTMDKSFTDLKDPNKKGDPVAKVVKSEKANSIENGIIGQVKEENDDQEHQTSFEGDALEIDETSKMDVDEDLEEEVKKPFDIYEFKDSMSMDSDQEPNSSVEDVEKNVKEKMQKTLLVKSIVPIHTANIASIRDLHPNLDKSSILKTFFSYFFFVESSSKETREEVKIALKESDFDFAEYCFNCAHRKFKDPNCGAHDPNPNHFNKIAKLLQSKYPNFEQHPDRVLVVKRSRCIDLDEVDGIMKLSPNIVNLNFGFHFFLEFSSVGALNDASKLLDEFTGHSIASNPDSGFPLKCFRVINHGGYRNYDFKKSGVVQKDRNIVKKSLDLKNGEERRSLLLFGQIIKKMSTGKAILKNNLIGNQQCKNVVYGSTKSNQPDYSDYAVAFFETEEDAITAYKECQYIYYMEKHVNIVFASRFLQEINTSKFVKSNTKPKANTKKTFREELGKLKMINKAGAKTSKITPKKRTVESNPIDLLSSFPLLKPKNPPKGPLKKDPSHPTYLRQNYDSDSRDNFSGSEDDTHDLGRRKSLPASSLATTSFESSSRETRKGPALLDNYLDHPSSEQPPIAQSTPKVASPEKFSYEHLLQSRRDLEKTKEMLSEDKQQLIQRFYVDQPNINEQNIEQSQPTDPKLMQEVSELKLTLDKLKSENEILQDENNTFKIKQFEYEEFVNAEAKLLSEKAKVEQLCKENKCKDERIEIVNKENDENREKCVALENKVKTIQPLEEEVSKVKQAMETLKEENRIKDIQIEELKALKEKRQSSLIGDNETLKEKMVDMEKQLKTKTEELEAMEEKVESITKELKEKNKVETSLKAMEEEKDKNLQKIEKLQEQTKGFKTMEEEKDKKLQEKVKALKAMEEKDKQLQEQIKGFQSIKEEKDNKFQEQVKAFKAMEEEKNKKVQEKIKEFKAMEEEKDKKLQDQVKVFKAMEEEKDRKLQEQIKAFKTMEEEKGENLLTIEKIMKEEKSINLQKIEKLEEQLEGLKSIEEENLQTVENLERQLNALQQEKHINDNALQKEKDTNDSALQKVKELQEKLTGCQEEEKEKAKKEKIDWIEKHTDKMIKLSEKLTNATNELKAEKSKNEQLKDENKSLEEEVKKGNDFYTVDLLKKKSTLTQENNQLKVAQGRHERDIEKLNVTNLELQGKIDSHEERIKVIQNKDEELKSENQSLQKSLEIAKEENTKSGKLLENKKADFAVLSQEHQSLKNSLEMEKEQNKKQVSEKEADFNKLQEENKSLKSSLEMAKEQKEKQDQVSENKAADFAVLSKDNLSLKSSLEIEKENHDTKDNKLKSMEAQHTKDVAELNRCKDDLKQKEKDILDKDAMLNRLENDKEELEDQHKKVIHEKDNEIQIFESRLESLQTSSEAADKNSKEEAEHLFNAQIMEVKKRYDQQLMERGKENANLNNKIAKLEEENKLCSQVKVDLENQKKQISQLKVDLTEKFRKDELIPLQTELAKSQATIKRLEADNADLMKRFRAGTSTSVTSSPTLANILRQPPVPSTHSNVMNHPNPPSLSPRTSIGGSSKKARHVKSGTASILEESVNPFENHPQRQAAASAQIGLLPNQTIKSRTPPLSNARVSPMNTSTVMPSNGPIEVRVQMGSERGRGGGMGGFQRGRGGIQRGQGGRGGIQGGSQNLRTPVTNNSHLQVTSVVSLNQQRRTQPTPIAPKAPIGPNGNTTVVSSSAPNVISSYNQQSLVQAFPSVSNQQSRVQAFPTVSNQQPFMTQHVSPAVTITPHQLLNSQHVSFPPSSLSSVKRQISSVNQQLSSVEQQLQIAQQPISESMQLHRNSEQEEIVMQSSPQEIAVVDLEDEEEEDESEESVLAQLIEGLTGAFEETWVAYTAKGEEFDLQANYRDLIASLKTSDFEEKIWRPALNEAFRVFFGITDIDENGDNIPRAAGVQNCRVFQYKMQQQQQQGQNQI